VRPGRPEDLPALRALLADEVRGGVRDTVPSEPMLSRIVGGFDWEARSRVIDDEAGPRAMVLALEHPDRDGSVVRVETVARDEDGRLRLLRWGIDLSRAAGADVAQIWLAAGMHPGAARLGMEVVRTFWRMDRPHLESVPKAPMPPGYRLARSVDRRVAAQVFNRAFAEHWRFQPLDPEAVVGRPADLNLLAVAADGQPAAVVWCEVERHEPDSRAQPVGMVEVVGTLPEHRRHGLAYALTAEALRRLRRRGARSASLYVDALNPTHAFDVYHRLGFEVAFQYEVFEAALH
jgi:mycothiol synthase